MFTTPFQLTKSMHRDVYPAVDPKNPALSAKNKIVIITGAGGGLGAVRFSNDLLISNLNLIWGCCARQWQGRGLKLELLVLSSLDVRQKLLTSRSTTSPRLTNQSPLSLSLPISRTNRASSRCSRKSRPNSAKPMS